MEFWDALSLDKDDGQVIMLEKEAKISVIKHVSLYDGKVKSPYHKNGRLTLTNHRLLWEGADSSACLSLSLVLKIESRSSFLKNTTKLTLFLKEKHQQSFVHPVEITKIKWTCKYCACENENVSGKCIDCGMKLKANKNSASGQEQPEDEEEDEDGDHKDNSVSESTACQVCTFLNKSGRVECEMCYSPLQTNQTPINSAKHTSIKSEKPLNTSDNKVSIGFSLCTRQQVSAFTDKLSLAIQGRDWKKLEEEDCMKKNIVGISGLLEKASLGRAKNSENIDESFTDLDNLMINASNLVELSKKISNKIKGNAVDEKSVGNILKDIGLEGGILVKGENQKFYQDLAVQISKFMKSLQSSSTTDLTGAKAERFSIKCFTPLTDIYCLYNRARAINLVSPSDFYNAVKLFDQISADFGIVRLSSGLLVIRDKKARDPKDYITDLESGGNEKFIDAMGLAARANISLPIANMYLKDAEEDGLLCRDCPLSGLLKYYPNQFKDLKFPTNKAHN